MSSLAQQPALVENGPGYLPWTPPLLNLFLGVIHPRDGAVLGVPEWLPMLHVRSLRNLVDWKRLVSDDPLHGSCDT